MASIADIVTLGYGSFGSVNDLPTLGYGLGVVVPVTPPAHFCPPSGFMLTGQYTELNLTGTHTRLDLTHDGITQWGEDCDA